MKPQAMKLEQEDQHGFISCMDGDHYKARSRMGSDMGYSTSEM